MKAKTKNSKKSNIKRKKSETQENLTTVELEEVTSFKENESKVITEESEINSKEVATNLKVGTIHEVDDYMRGNEFIIRGYRLNFDTGKKIIRR
jgi:hypothetical protein